MNSETCTAYNETVMTLPENGTSCENVEGMVGGRLLVRALFELPAFQEDTCSDPTLFDQGVNLSTPKKS